MDGKIQEACRAAAAECFRTNRNAQGLAFSALAGDDVSVSESVRKSAPTQQRFGTRAAAVADAAAKRKGGK